MPDERADTDAGPAGPFWFLADREAFVRRYVLSLVLAPPPGRRAWEAAARARARPPSRR
jgi:hypothetical protein